jgi:biopolymer transport protein ExbB
MRASFLTSVRLRLALAAIVGAAALATSAPLMAQQTPAPAPTTPPTAAAPAPTAPAPTTAAPATAAPGAAAPGAVAPEATAPSAAPTSTAPAAEAGATSAAPPQLAHDLSPVGMFMNATVIVKVVMIALALASVWTWAILLDKSFFFAALNRRSEAFLRTFRNSATLDEAYAKVQNEKNSPLVNIFRSGMEELRLSLTPGAVAHPELRAHVEDRTRTAMEITEAAESQRLGAGMGVLASIGSVSPFVGLFGTVWGIMNAFIGIANTQTTNLAVVAPGIAEALMATAIGLVAAIPAVIFYNKFARQIGDFNNRMNGFVGEFQTVLSRYLDHKV